MSYSIKTFPEEFCVVVHIKLSEIEELFNLILQHMRKSKTSIVLKKKRPQRETDKILCIWGTIELGHAKVTEVIQGTLVF